MVSTTGNMQKWSPDYPTEFLRRLAKRDYLLEKPDQVELIEAYYASNCIAWINDWCITFDPRAKKPLPRLMPFILFPRQKDFVGFVLSCIFDKESGLCEKARDMGITWLCCAISIWLWLYHEGSVIGWGSLKSENVDKKDNPKAIFPKMRQIIASLPRWMLPYGFKMKVHATHMQIINPANGASIIGESGDNIGRGGRTTIYFKDESAHYLHPELIEAALGDNTDVQIDVSSVNGPGNVFYRRRMAGEVWYPDKLSTPNKTRVFIFDWSENPMKDQAWFDARRQKAEDEGLLHVFMQEVCRSYTSSLAKIIIPMEWIESAVDAHLKLNIMPGGERVAAQDVADGGMDKNALVARTGIVCHFADDWGGESGDAARIAIPKCREMGITLLNYDSIGVGAGFKTEANTMKREGGVPKTMEIAPWSSASSVLDPEKPIIPDDKESPLNKDHYENLKAQSFFRLRTRFYKTHQAVTKGKVYDPLDLISLSSEMPKLQELKVQLTQPVHETSKSGKVLVDKTPEGTFSPNLADGVAMCYNPVRPKRGFFDL